MEVSPGTLSTTLGLPSGPQLHVSALSLQSSSLGPPLSRVNSFPQGSALSQETVRTLMHHALTTWGTESDLRFQEVGSQGPTEPDILIDFARAYHQDSYPFDGQGGTLAHAFFPKTHREGVVHFDYDETWTIGDNQGRGWGPAFRRGPAEAPAPGPGSASCCRSSRIAGLSPSSRHRPPAGGGPRVWPRARAAAHDRCEGPDVSLLHLPLPAEPQPG